MKNKKIMHLIASNFFGGPEKQIIEHLRLVNKNKYSGMVATFLEGDDNEVLDKAESFQIENIGIPMTGALDFHAQIALNQLIHERSIDLLCTHGYKACIMGWLAAKKNHIPLLAFSRGYTSENFKVDIYNWLDRKILSRADGLVSVSHGQKEKLLGYGITGKKSWVVHNAVTVSRNSKEIAPEEKNRFWAKFDIPPDSLIVVTAGRFSPEKGHKYLVDAIAKCQHGNKKVYYLFCGEGQCLEDLKKQCNSHGITDNCLFVGFRRDLMEIFQAMDLFVLPSLTEGLPNVVLEAYAFAKPVVATCVGGVPEIVENEVNGLIVEPGDATNLARAMDLLIQDAALRNTMGKAGLKKVIEEFNFERQNRMLLDIYAELLEGKTLQ